MHLAIMDTPLLQGFFAEFFLTCSSIQFVQLKKNSFQHDCMNIYFLLANLTNIVNDSGRFYLYAAFKTYMYTFVNRKAISNYDRDGSEIS